MLQRLVNTSPDIVMWGEHYGILSSLRAMIETADASREQFAKGFSHREYLFGDLNDVPDLSEHINPFDRDGLLEHVRRFTVELFTTELAPSMHWGFKEVRYHEPDLRFQRTLFPDARVVVLVRHPRDQVSSFVRAPWRRRPDLRVSAGRDELVRQVGNAYSAWIRQYESLRTFLEADAGASMVLTYDQLTDPSFDSTDVFRFIGVPAPPRDAVDAVIGHRSGSSDRSSAWSTDDRRLLGEVIQAIEISRPERELIDHFLGPGAADR